MADVLAVAYVLRLEDLAREELAASVAAGVAVALGAQVDRLGWEAVKANFDARLAEPPGTEDEVDRSPRGIKLRALGVR